MKVYNQCASLKGEKQDRYYDKHKAEIAAFTEAHKYMERHLNGRKQIPLDDWKRELAGLRSQRDVMLTESDLVSKKSDNR